MRDGGDAYDGLRANLAALWTALYRSPLDDPGCGASDRDPRSSAGQARANGCESTPDRVADPASGGPMGRRGLLGLPATPQDAISNVQYIDFPKCQVLSVSQDMFHGLHTLIDPDLCLMQRGNNRHRQSKRKSRGRPREVIALFCHPSRPSQRRKENDHALSHSQ